mmetsp:Transcript_28840/g.70143  ORF Transcript_28840/g.70143 Transcript_28840/m.70143 type:complete len:220 (-) Transcript_28840:72-731(-)
MATDGLLNSTSSTTFDAHCHMGSLNFGRVRSQFGSIPSSEVSADAIGTALIWKLVDGVGRSRTVDMEFERRRGTSTGAAASSAACWGSACDSFCAVYNFDSDTVDVINTFRSSAVMRPVCSEMSLGTLPAATPIGSPVGVKKAELMIEVQSAQQIIDNAQASLTAVLHANLRVGAVQNNDGIGLYSDGMALHVVVVQVFDIIIGAKRLARLAQHRRKQL